MDKINALVAFGSDFSLKTRLAPTLDGDVQVKYTFCENGRQALGKFMASRWDLCVICEDLPQLSGFQLTRKIRRENEVVPLIFLNEHGRSEPAYRAGADIVLPNDFNPDIFSYRAAAILKRCQPGPLHTTQYFGAYSFSPASGRLSRPDAGFEVMLSPHQAGIFHLLLSHLNQTLRRGEILRAVWNKDSYFNGRSMDVIINKLRKKLSSLEGFRIETIHGIGFRMSLEQNISPIKSL